MAGNPDKALTAQTHSGIRPPMPRVRAILTSVSAYPHTRPSQRPHCGVGALHRRGEVSKRVKDIYVEWMVFSVCGANGFVGLI